MANRLRANLAASAAAALFLPRHVDAHCVQVFPVTRQYSWSRDFHGGDFENLEISPFAYNAGGTVAVKERAADLTDADVLDELGGSQVFPLSNMELAENGNYQETNEVAVRHGVCGDPKLGWDDNFYRYSSPNKDWEVLEGSTFESGGEIEIEVIMVYYHHGHFEFRLCDTADLDDPDGVATQECFNMHQLDRAYNPDDASVIDPDFPGRYYTDPPCRGETNEVEQNVSDYYHERSEPYNIKMRYQVPRMECKHCVLQMHYLTGHMCQHIGYSDFDPPSWNSKCAPDTEDWINLSGTADGRVCGVGHAYAEEFWGCSDIAITSSGGSGSEPTAPETPSPMAVPVTAPDTPAPVDEAEPVEYEYLGCYKDSKEDRVLTTDRLDDGDMTAELCSSFCSSSGASYMALQWGWECWCSSDDMLDYDRHGEEGATCDYRCRGDEDEWCGGYDAFSLYELIAP